MINGHGVGTWTALTPNGVPPPSKVYHSAAAVGNNIYITGGAAGANGANKTVYYDSFKNEWVSQSDAELPHDAQVADMAASGGVLYLFGGKDTVQNKKIVNTLHIFRTVTNGQKWDTINPLAPPPERNGDSMTSIAGMMIVFGGWDQTQYYNDVYGLDTTELVLPQDNATPLMWFKLSPDGGSPAPRNSHTMVSVGHELLMFGGFTHDISVGGSFTQCPEKDKCVYFDDLWSLRLPAKIDTLEIEWKQITPIDDHKPLGRWWHAASSVGDRMYIYGGLSSTGTVLSDVWSYSSDVNAWRVLAANPKGGAYGMSMTVISGSLYTYGGFTEPGWAGRTDQLWRYDSPLVETDDDGEEIIDLGPAGSSNTFSLTGVNVGLVLIILLNLAILGLNVFVYRKNNRNNGNGNDGSYSSI